MKYLTLIFSLILGYFYLTMYPNFDNEISVRPFVYRQLMPILAGTFGSLVGITYTSAMRVLIMGFVALMVFALRYLYTSMYPEDTREELYVSVTVVLVFILAMFPTHSYDIPTVTLFVLAYALLRRGMITMFVFLFPIVCLNRETAFLLIPLFIMYCWHDLRFGTIIGVGAILVFIYAAIRLILIYSFSSYPGNIAQIHLWRNLQVYAMNPYVVMCTALMVFSLVSMMKVKWSYTPKIAKTVLLTLGPVITVLYLTVGITLELRVFLEVLPMLTLVGILER